MNYFYTEPNILTDDIFQTYNGDISNSSYDLRKNCYVIAEQVVAEHLETYLVPTVVTGSYSYRYGTLNLDHVYINSINSVAFFDSDGNEIYSTTTIPIGFFDDRYGYVEIPKLSVGIFFNAKKIQLVYNCGLPNDVSTNPLFLMALCETAKIFINELLGYGNESIGDVGVQDFSNQQYSEQRVKLLRTDFGTSAKAQMIHKMLKPFKVVRFVGL